VPHVIIIIIIIGATSRFEPRHSSEASASRPCSLQHSSSFSPPTSWHHPSRRNLYSDKTFHKPILKSLDRFVGRRVLDSPAVASLDFVTMLFSGASCQPCAQPPAILEDRLDCFLVWVFITDQSGMGEPSSSYATASIAS